MLMGALPEELSTVPAIDSLCGGGLLITMKSDLSLEGEPTTVWLLVTNKELVVVKTAPSICIDRAVSLESVESTRIDHAIGSDFLQLKINEVWVDFVRCSKKLGKDIKLVEEKLKSLTENQEFLIEHFPTDTHESNLTESLSVWKLMGTIWKLLKPFHWSIPLLLLLSCVGIGIELVPPILQRFLVDNILQEQQVSESLLFMLSGVVLSLLILRAINAGVMICKERMSSDVGTTLTSELRAELVGKLEKLPVAYHDRNQVGALMSRVAYDTEAMHTFVHQLTSGILIHICQILAIAGMLFFLNPKLALFTLLPMPLVVLSSWYFMKYMHPQHHRYWEAVGKQAAALSSMLSGIRVVKAFTQENREYDRFKRSSDQLRQSRLALDTSNAAFSAIIGLLFGLGGLVVWFIGGRDVISGDMTLGSLMAFISYVAMFYTPLTQLAESTSWVSQFRSACERIFEILDCSDADEEEPTATTLPLIEGNLSFNDVTFGYHENEDVLKRLSFVVNSGEMIGIVGRSGSGKSSLINLISRMYDPRLGQIELDGENIQKLSRKKLRRSIGVVLQEPFLFEGTIEENILYGEPDASHEEILEAAFAANAHHFITDHPFAYHTFLQEGGRGLSGGEKQRLSIARAFLYSPSILILDEATSAVDSESEGAIESAIRHFSINRTTIAIAHRFSTLKRADRLLVLDQGQLVEEGTHTELLQQGGLYSRLYQLQFNDSTPDRQPSESPGEASDWGEPNQQRCEPNWLTRDSIQIEIEPHQILKVITKTRTFRGVSGVCLFPGSFEDRFISLKGTLDNSRHVEIGIIKDLRDWPQEVRSAILTSIRRRYLLRTVHGLEGLTAKGRTLTCKISTQYGQSEVTLEQKGIHRFGRKGRLLIGCKGEYYCITDINRISLSQQKIIDLYVGT